MNDWARSTGDGQETGEAIITVSQGSDAGGCPTGLAVERGEDAQILDKLEISG